MTKHRRRIGFVSVLTAFLFAAALPAAAEEADHKDQHAEHAEHAFHRHHLSVFIGNTENEDNRDADTFGVGYDYRLGQYHGIGVMVEYVGAHDTVTAVVPLQLHPWEGLKVFGAPGAEFEDGHAKLLIRLGLGYQFFFGDAWSIEPVVNWDAVHGDLKTIFGLHIGRGF